MEKRLKLWYDEEGDILEISAGEPQEAISEEIGDDVVLHRNFKTIKSAESELTSRRVIRGSALVSGSCL